MATKLHDRQVEHRNTLPRLSQESKPTLKTLLPSIDFEVTPVFELKESTIPDSVLNIGSGLISNSETGLSRAFSPIQSKVFDFTGGTVQFPSNSPGTIIVTPGDNDLLTVSNNMFIAVLIQVDPAGQIKLGFGTEASTSSLATNSDNFPTPSSLYLPVGYVVLNNLAGTILPVRNVNIVQFESGGSGGSGSGAGISITPAGGFQAALEDELTVDASDDNSNIRNSETNASFDSELSGYVILCDKTITVTATGTSFSISAIPSYTLAVGDVVYTNNEFRRIIALTDQQNGTLDTGFLSDPSAAAGMVSQAVWTKDIVNIGEAVDQNKYIDLFGTPDHDIVHISTNDSSLADDSVSDIYNNGSVFFSASNSGVVADTGLPLGNTFAESLARPLFGPQLPNYSLLDNTNKQRMFVVFFASFTTSSVTNLANLLDFKVSLYKEEGVGTGGMLNTAYGYIDGAGTSKHITSFNTVFDSVLGQNVTEISLDWDFVPGINPDEADADIDVMFEGVVLPREYTGISGDFWKPVAGSTSKLRLSQDFAGQNVSVHIRKRQGTIDSSPLSLAKINALDEIVVGNAADVTSGVAHYSSIQNAITDAASGAQITLLNRTFSLDAAITVSKKIFLKGSGNSCVIDGTISFNAGSSASMVQWVKFNENITVANTVTKIILTNGWINSAKTLTDNNPTSDDSLYTLLED